MKRIVLSLLVLASMLAGPAALAEVTTFDELPEGFAGTTFLSGGIQFSHGTWFAESVDLPFAIDDGTNVLPGHGFEEWFTPPNVMKVGGYSTGPNACPYVRVHSWEADVPGQTRTLGRVDVFYIDDFPGALVSLHALRNDEIVATDSFMIVNADPFTALHAELRVQGVEFDRLLFEVTGGTEDGGILAQFDNVELSDFCLGDLDGNGQVGLSDLAQLLANYGTTSGAAYEDGDLDEDGDVDLSDLAALLGVYGTVCS